MNRQELIDSLPEWLRERADELLDGSALGLAFMCDWDETPEGYHFWRDCNDGAFFSALDKLKESNPEVYQKYYAKYVKESLKKDKRQELIDSLPEWLRERADELLRYDAEKLADMDAWIKTDEGVDFWGRCLRGNFEDAIKWLRYDLPEVYELHYAKYFDMKDSQYTETELNQLFPKQLPVEHTEEYKQRQALWKAEQDRKQLKEKKDADKYRKILVSQLLAKGQNSVAVTQILKQYDLIVYGKP